MDYNTIRFSTPLNRIKTRLRIRNGSSFGNNSYFAICVKQRPNYSDNKDHSTMIINEFLDPETKVGYV